MTIRSMWAGSRHRKWLVVLTTGGVLAAIVSLLLVTLGSGTSHRAVTPSTTTVNPGTAKAAEPGVAPATSSAQNTSQTKKGNTLRPASRQIPPAPDASGGAKPKPIQEDATNGTYATSYATIVQGPFVGGGGTKATDPPVAIGGFVFDPYRNTVVDCANILSYTVGGGTNADSDNENRWWRMDLYDYTSGTWSFGPWRPYNNGDQTVGTDFDFTNVVGTHPYYPEVQFGVFNRDHSVFYTGYMLLPYFIQHGAVDPDNNVNTMYDPYGYKSQSCTIGSQFSN